MPRRPKRPCRYPGCPNLCESGTYCPVSYTHLDVYKRQHHHRAVCAGKGRWHDDLCHPRGGLGLGWRGTLRGVSAGNERGTVEDIFQRSFDLVVRTASFG